MPVPPPRARTTAQPRRRQPPTPLRRRRGRPDSPLNPRPLRPRSGLGRASCRYGTAAAIAAMSYSLCLALRCPASCLCWGQGKQRRRRRRQRINVEYKGDSLSTAIYREGALPPPPSFLCMNQPGNSVSFGTPLTLKSLYNTRASYKVSLNGILATAA